MRIVVHEDESLLSRVIWFFGLPILNISEWFKRKVATPAGSVKLQIPRHFLKKNTTVKERQVNGINVYVISSGQASDKASKRVIYFPGGGFTSPATPFHFRNAAEIASRFPNVVVNLVSWPLAPNNPASTTFPQLVELYKVLAEEADQAGQELTVSGDSAGDNLALAIPLHVLANDPSPSPLAKIVTIVPVASLEADILGEAAAIDPVLGITLFKEMRAKWAAELDVTDARISPVYGDYSKLKEADVKVYIISSGRDCCCPGTLLAYEKMKKAGVEGMLSYWPRQVHVSPFLHGFGVFRDCQKLADEMFSFY